MKKKIVLLMMVSVVAMSMMACGKSNSDENTDNNQPVTTESSSNTDKNDDNSNDDNAELTTLGVLEKVWAVYSDDDKPIVMGGDAENSVDGAPGIYNIEDTEGIDSMFHITKEAVDMADEAASAVHAMNANTFTSSVFHLKDSANKEAFATSVKDSVLSTRWMCGFPEKLVVISVQDEYVISAFGNGDMIELFKNNVSDVFGAAADVLAEENIE